MYDYLIKQYIDKINENDIIRFACSNGITLKKEEVEIIQFHIKKNWKTLIHGNPEPIFQEVKTKLEPETYKKMIELYYFFKEKYQNYL